MKTIMLSMFSFFLILSTTTLCIQLNPPPTNTSPSPPPPTPSPSPLPPSPSPPPPSPPSHSPKLTNHILALSYGYGLKSCYPGRIKAPLPRNRPVFTIHGLWPNDLPLAKATQPRPSISSTSRNYYSSSLDRSEIQGLLTDLDALWPNLNNYGDAAATLLFWKNEWVDHGTCSKLTKYNYFEETMSLFKRLSLDSVVKGGGVLAPDDTKIYSVGDFTRAFNNHTPYLVCAGKKGKEVLTDLYFCLDATAANFVSCTTYYDETNNGSCNNGFKLPET